MSFQLTEDRIYLQPISLREVSERYVSWLNDAETNKGLLAHAQAATLDSVRAYVEARITDPNTVMFAVFNKENNEHIGNVKLDQFDRLAHTCEIGILIGEKSQWGKGIATEVMRAALKHAFNQLNIRKVLLAVYANNPAAIHLYEKLGFVHEGCLKEHVYAEGQFIDKHLMSLFARDFHL